MHKSGQNITAKNNISQKGNLLIVLSIVIVIIIGVTGGYLLGTRRTQSNTQYISQQPSSSALSTQDASPSVKPLQSVLKDSSNSANSEAQLLATHYKGVDCAQLVGQTVRPNNDVVELKKDICISERAWFENNSTLCNSHSDKDQCFGWMAIKTGDLSLCQLKNKKTGYFWIEERLKDTEKQKAWLYECYNGFANWRNEPDICNSIPYKSLELLQSCKEISSKWEQKFSDFDESPI